MLQSSDHFCGIPLVLLRQVHVSPVLRIPELNTALQVLDLCCFVPFKDLALFSPCMFSELQTKLMIIPPRSAPCTRECKAENTFPAFQSSVPLSAFMPVCHNHLMLWRTWLMGSL